jgi:hypothetical protein
VDTHDVSNFYASHLTKLFDVCQEYNLEKPFANEVQINLYVYRMEKDTLDLCFQYNIQLIAYSPLGFNAAIIVLQDTGMQTIANKEIGITTEQVSLAWLLSKRICVIPKSNNIQWQKENFASKDAIYKVLYFSDDMDKISEGKNPTAFLLYNAEKSQEDANRLRLLVWNDDLSSAEYKMALRSRRRLLRSPASLDVGGAKGGIVCLFNQRINMIADPMHFFHCPSSQGQFIRRHNHIRDAIDMRPHEGPHIEVE